MCVQLISHAACESGSSCLWWKSTILEIYLFLNIWDYIQFALPFFSGAFFFTSHLFLSYIGFFLLKRMFGWNMYVNKLHAKGSYTISSSLCFTELSRMHRDLFCTRMFFSPRNLLDAYNGHLYSGIMRQILMIMILQWWSYVFPHFDICFVLLNSQQKSKFSVFFPFVYFGQTFAVLSFRTFFPPCNYTMTRNSPIYSGWIKILARAQTPLVKNIFFECPKTGCLFSFVVWKLLYFKVAVISDIPFTSTPRKDPGSGFHLINPLTTRLSGTLSLRVKVQLFFLFTHQFSSQYALFDFLNISRWAPFTRVVAPSRCGYPIPPWVVGLWDCIF